MKLLQRGGIFMLMSGSHMSCITVQTTPSRSVILPLTCVTMVTLHGSAGYVTLILCINKQECVSNRMIIFSLHNQRNFETILEICEIKDLYTFWYIKSSRKFEKPVDNFDIKMVLDFYLKSRNFDLLLEVKSQRNRENQ